MRVRWRCTVSRFLILTGAPLALIALAVGLAGCGGVGVSGAETATGNQLTIYSSLPLQGPEASASEEIVNGEKLALDDAGGRVGPFKIGYVSLDDASPSSATWAPGVTATNAKTAAADPSAIAFLGDYNSAATAVSLPLMNAAGILQVSPASPYVGLTSSLDAGQDEPERFYPSGQRTFGRLQPGDTVEAGAQVQLMQALGVHRLYVLNDQEPFDMPLADIVSGDAEAAGIALASHDSLLISSGASFTGEAEKIAHSGAQAVFFAGGAAPGVVTLWRQLHRADPGLLLLGSSATASESFAAEIGEAGANTYLTTPLLPVGLYPASAQQVLRAYSHQFGSEGTANALYGYETMSVVLSSISGAGAHGNDRQTVIDRFFSVKARNSVIGSYSIQANGETTLSRYGVDRVTGGHLAFNRAIEVRL